jgi:GntR family transcriptional regulator/MocR family aminotransferase
MGARSSRNLWSGLFRISAGSGQTLQSQIRRALVSAILDRQVPINQPLPSCRALAKDLKVARGTVALAYLQLVDQGLLVARERRGHFVNPDAVTRLPRVRTAPRTAGRGRGPDWSRRLTFRPSDDRQIEKPADWISYRYPFVYGQFDPTLFPTAEWRECSLMALGVREIRNWASDMIDRDDPLLVEQIQARLLPRRGIFASPDQIMVTLGAQNALFLLATLLAGGQSIVAVEEPGYPDVRNIFTSRGAKVVRAQVDEEGLDPDALPERCDYVFTTPSHHCPTSARLSLDRRRQLLDRAGRDDFVVIEDDYDSQISDPDAPLPSLKSLDRECRVIYVGSLSKTLAPGLRLGYLVAEPPLVKELKTLRRLMLRHPPANNQRAVALFLSLGHHDALIARLTQAYTRRRKILSAALARHLPQLRSSDGRSGNAFWLEGPPGFDTEALARIARENGVLVEPGAVFYSAEPPPANMMRMGISSIAEADIEPGVRQLAGVAGTLIADAA